MYNQRNKSWIICAIAGLTISLISLFFPIIIYTNRDNLTYSFNIIQLFEKGFAETVQTEFTGGSLVYISKGTFDVILEILGVEAAVSIILSFAGIQCMSKQYESQWPFRMTIIGLIGTSVPAALLIIAYALSTNYYLGSIRLGLYVFVTPVSVLVACIAVMRRHRCTQEELQIQREAAKYILVAGDLRR